MNYAMADIADKPQQAHIRWERVQLPDDTGDRPDDNDDGFWPSLDPEAGGWVGDNPERSYDDQMADAKERMAAFERGDWGYIGVVARAHIRVPIGGNSFRLFTIDSAGLWGVESDSGEDYFNEIFADEKAELLKHLQALGEAVAEESIEEDAA